MKSIRTQLTLYYTVAIFVILVPIALFLYWGMINLLYKADYQFLADEVDTIQYMVKEMPSDKTILKQEVIEIPLQHVNSIYRYYIRVMDANKKIVIETPGMHAILPPEKPFSQMTEVLLKKTYLRYSQHDNSFLAIQAPLYVDRQPSAGIIQIVLDVSYQHSVINDRKNLFLALVIGALLAWLMGFLVARKGLQSLSQLTKTAKAISVSSLHQRINPKAWPAELDVLAQAFNGMLDRIESSFLRSKQFSADLSHELRTPITNMIGEAEVALSYANSEQDYRKVIESSLEELERMSHLIENILFLAQTENPLLDLKKQRINVYENISLVAEFHQPIADEKNIKMTVVGSGEIEANVVMFRRMINNLLSNALKYTPEGGQIQMEIRPLSAAVEIIIKDNGMGIAPGNVAKVFDRLYREDAARSQSPGTGLGLSIVKSIADLHHASITIASVQHQGTTVTLVFPH